MLHPFSPSWLKKADRFSKGVKKFIAYQRDLIPEDRLSEVTEMRNAYNAAIKAKDREALEGKEASGEQKAVEGLERKLLRLCEGAVPDYNASPLKENIEVIVVAVIVALGIRAYFLQPFKIPTASMQPTLNGIIAKRMEGSESSPNIVTQAIEYAWKGRNYVNFVIPEKWGTVKFRGFRQHSKVNFFTFTELYFSDGRTEYSDFVYAPARQVLNELCWDKSVRELKNIPSDDTPPNRVISVGTDGLTQDLSPAGGQFSPEFKGGDVFARGYVESGDQLLVDKLSYHFRRPNRDEVFVFSTENIRGIGKTQHYIKRLTALPGDRLRIEPPNLFINGEIAEGPGSRSVMEREPGYTIPWPPGGNFFLGRADERSSAEIELPGKSYMAMGDNSANSSDSRYWGPVPEPNLVGPALLVYWPFSNHFGLIR